MEFRLLGPLDVTIDGRSLPIGGPKQRAVLALLALHAGEVVSVERLIDTVWADEPPDTARNTLQTYIRHLRRVIGSEQIAHRSPGYVLVVDRDDVDVQRFAELMQRGRQLVPTDPGGAVTVLRYALETWHGPALEDLSALPGLQPEIAHLESMRLSVTEELMDVELALGHHAAIVPELELLVSEHPLRERLVAQYMAALYGSGRQADALSAFRGAAEVLRDELGISPSSELVQLHQRMLAQDDTLTVASPARVVPRNPYKGLRPFLEADTEQFFGRERVVERLVHRLAGQVPGSRFLAIVGPSGSGKSSVVAAGLVPAIRAGALPGSEHWVIAVMRPGFNPFDELMAALAGQFPVSADLRAQLETERGFDAAADAVLTEPGSELFVVIDQFEEVFTLVAEERDRTRFLTSVVAASTSQRGRVRVVVTLRADFYDRPLALPQFGDLIAGRTEALLPLSVEELERVVAEPALRVGVRVDGHLLTEIMLEFASQPAALPLLQYALSETFENRDDGVLTLRAFRDLGGLAGALTRGAEETYGHLAEPAQAVARQLFLRLVTPGDVGIGHSRRRVLRAELETLGLDPVAVTTVIESFGARRLLAFDRDASSGQATVEVAHEALLTQWVRLREWLEAAREDVHLERRMASASAEWIESERDESILLQGDRLTRVEGWTARAGIALTSDEHAFLDASLAHRRDLEEAEAARAVRESIAERHSKRLLQGVVAVFAVLTVVAAVLAGLTLQNQRRSALEARIATGRQLAAASVANLEVDPERSILLALEGMEVTHGIEGSSVREVSEALHRALWRSRLVLTVPEGGGAALGPAGVRFATLGRDGRATVWAAEDGQRLFDVAGHVGAVNDVAFGPTGTTFATAGADGTVRLWQSKDGSALSTFRMPTGADRVSFGPNGERLAASGADGSVHVWQLRSGAKERVLEAPRGDPAPAYPPHGLAFSPDGTLVASAEGRASAVIWEVRTGRVVSRLVGHEWEVMDLAFDPRGGQVATASIDGTAKIWNATTGALVATLADHKGDVYAVGWSPDGSRIATGATDGGVRVWDSATGVLLQSLAGHQGVVTSVAFTADGARLLTSGGDDTTRVWDLSVSGARDWVTVEGSTRHYGGLAFQPRGTLFAVAGSRYGATLYDTAAGTAERVLGGSAATLGQLSFSPDGTRVGGAAGSAVDADPANRTVPIWVTGTGQLAMTLKGHTDEVSNVVWSPDGRQLVTSSADGTLRLWESATGRAVRTIQVGSDARAVSFSPDGRTLVAGPDANGLLSVFATRDWTRTGELGPREGTVLGFAFVDDRTIASFSDNESVATLWDVASGRELRTLRGHNGAVLGLTVSPDHRSIATGSADGTAKLWDAGSGRDQFTFVGHTKSVYGVRFSPDGRFLATASIDGTVALHPLRTEELAALARTRVTRILTDDECRQYLRLTKCHG